MKTAVCTVADLQAEELHHTILCLTTTDNMGDGNTGR